MIFGAIKHRLRKDSHQMTVIGSMETLLGLFCKKEAETYGSECVSKTGWCILWFLLWNIISKAFFLWKKREISIWNFLNPDRIKSTHKSCANGFFGFKVNLCILRYIISIQISWEPKGPTITVPMVSLNSKEIRSSPDTLFLLIVSEEPDILVFPCLGETQAISCK